MGQGAYISGIAHVALILWALVGGLFLRADDPLPVETMDVSVLTPEEFDQLVAAAQPAPAPDQAVTPEPAPEPDPAPEPPPETTPEPVAEPDPAPIEPPAPEPVPEVPELPVSETPTPQQADIVSTEVTPAPEPEAAPAPDVATQSAPDEQAQPESQQTDAAAPEATTTEIVTEAETPSTAAPTRSILPAARPSFEVAEVQPEPTPEPPQQPTPEPEPKDDPIAEALAQATAEAPPSPTPKGPPLSSGEKDALRVSVQRCWNVGSLSTEALRTTVTVFVAMQPDGRPVTGSLRMVDFQGGSQAAASKAYEAARRAIIRCGSSGFDLPREKYSQWAEIEMIFNPEQMRIK